MESVGHTLREARLRLNLTLEQVSAETRISVKNLAAIEADELSRINSPFFYRSFVRQFATKVKLDYASIVDAVQQAAGTMPEPLVPGQAEIQVIRVSAIRQNRKRRPNLRWFRSVASLCVMLAACTGIYTMWQQSNANWHGLVAQLTARLVALKTKVAPVTTASKTAALADNPAIAASDSQNSDESQGDAKSPEPVAKPPAPPNERPSSPTLAESIESGIHVELAAIEPSWLSIVADGKEIFSGVLDASQTKVLEGHDSARIRTGNAGGLSFTFNGKEIGVLGPRGQIRTVVFTRDNYQVLPTAPQVALATFIPNGE
jgi:cytoskeleton protein RodZ